MPRPPVKRSKPNNSNQVVKHVANNPLSSSPAARRRQLQEQLAQKDVGRVPNDSDDSDLLVVKTRNPRNGRGVPRREIFSSGGVAQGDSIAAHKSPSNKRQRLSPKGISNPEARLNGNWKNAPLQTRGLRPINRLSTSQTARSSTSTAPTSVRPPPLGLKSSNASRARIQEIPTADTSILGPIKIRKRQPSILRLIDAPESSILDQDLEDFLPDDESTPLNLSRKRKLSSPSRAPPPAPPAQSQPQPRPEDFTAGREAATNTEPDLPAAPSSTLSQRREPPSEIDRDIMAPPRSSSSAPSPVKAKAASQTKNTANTRKAREAKSLSTTALQALMPARHQQRSRRDRAAKPKSEFDIPEDSSDPQNDTTENQRGDHDAEESYIANRKPTRRGKKHAPPMKLQKKKTPPVRKPTTNTKHSQAGKGGSSKSSKTSTQSPSTTRTTPAAKTSLSQQQHHPKSVKSYSRVANENGGTQGLENEDNKENRPSLSSGGCSRRVNQDEAASLDAAATAGDDDDDDNISIEVARGKLRPHGNSVTAVNEPEDGVREQQARLAQKFKEVDGWEMEFEDVTLEAGDGSDGLAR